MSITALSNHLQNTAGLAVRLGSWLIPRQQQRLSYWTLEQLNVRPYQHLLEIGYGTGSTIEQVARRLKIGFLAGIDSSVSMYRQATRRNEHFIRQELMQLHVGPLCELNYPSQYFHTIYGTNVHLRWSDPLQEFLRLFNFLKSGGRMVMIVQPQSTMSQRESRAAIERLEEDFLAIGLTDIRIRYQESDATACVAISGLKP